MSNKQQEGQDGISWLEEFRNLSDDAAIEDMTTPDLLCVIYVTGIRNNELREKLLEISRTQPVQHGIKPTHPNNAVMTRSPRAATTAAADQLPTRHRVQPNTHLS